MRWWPLWTALIAAGAMAEQSVSFGDYTVHYSAFSTQDLSEEVARAYQIQRSTKRALLNVSVLKKLMGTTGQPVRARVKAIATNLHGQTQTIEMRELNDRGAIYYIGEFPVSNAETLKFNLEIDAEGEPAPFATAFDQEFFTE
jgi:hypothetical protein